VVGVVEGCSGCNFFFYYEVAAFVVHGLREHYLFGAGDGALCVAASEAEEC
jgi:hypothetical protein